MSLMGRVVLPVVRRGLSVPVLRCNASALAQPMGAGVHQGPVLAVLVAAPHHRVDVQQGTLQPGAAARDEVVLVLQEGTDYGEQEYSLDEKVARVEAQLKRGDAKLLFDPDTHTVSIVLEG